jgi:uncharacterized protein YbaA (DUF1428 family)
MEDVTDTARAEAYDSALADAARLLKRTGSQKAAKMVEALREDTRRVREGQATQFPALRAAVPLPGS